MHYAPKDSLSPQLLPHILRESFSASSLADTVQDASLHYAEKAKRYHSVYLNALPQDLALPNTATLVSFSIGSLSPVHPPSYTPFTSIYSTTLTTSVDLFPHGHHVQTQRKHRGGYANYSISSHLNTITQFVRIA